MDFARVAVRLPLKAEGSRLRSRDMNIKIDDKLIYLGAGCGIGLILGLLFAPQSGEETRHNLTNKVEELTHKVQDRISHSSIGDSASQTLNSVIEKGKNVAHFGRQRLNESLEAGKRKYSEMMEREDPGPR
jgi:gas vesicle protein